MAEKNRVIDSAAVLRGEVLRRFPSRRGHRLPPRAICQVGENHQAVFFRDGRATGAVGPGRHELAPLPAVAGGGAGSAPANGDSGAESLCFVDQHVFSRVGWEAPRPVPIRDRDLGEVSVRVAGLYTFRIHDPLRCLGEISPGRQPEGTDDLASRIAERIQGRLETLLPRFVHSLRELPRNYNELATELRLGLQLDLERMGIQLIDFYVTTLSPEEPRLGLAGGHHLVLPQVLKPRRRASRAARRDPGREPAAGKGVCASCDGTVPAEANFCPWCGVRRTDDA